jgi:molybdopterin-guanine dinucleotide biosynthesis protein A
MKEIDQELLALNLATEAQITEWASKFKICWVIIPKDNTYNEFFNCIVRVPNEYQLNEYLKKLDKSPIDANILLLNSCWLAGDEEIKGDDYVNAAVSQLAQTVIGPDSILLDLQEKHDGLIKVSKELIANWKKQYGKVYLVKVPKDETYTDFYFAVLKKPIRQIINRYLVQSEKAPFNASKEILRSLWLVGDEEIKSDTKYVSSCVKAIAEIIMGASGSLKKIS